MHAGMVCQPSLSSALAFVLPMHAGMVCNHMLTEIVLVKFYPCMQGWFGNCAIGHLEHRVLPMHAGMVCILASKSMRSTRDNVRIHEIKKLLGEFK